MECCEPLGKIFGILVISLLVFYLYINYCVYEALRKENAELWKSLGGGGFLGIISPLYQFSILNFIFKKLYLETGNSEIIKWGNIFWRICWGYLIILLVAFITMNTCYRVNGFCE